MTDNVFIGGVMLKFHQKAIGLLVLFSCFLKVSTVQGIQSSKAQQDNGIHRWLKDDPYSVLKFVQQYLPNNPIILEAGAFDGRETITMAKIWPLAKIHAFEPMPNNFDLLKQNTSQLKNVSIYKQALSDKEGNALFYVSELENKPGLPAGSGSLLAPKDHLTHAPEILFPHQITVETTTIDRWAKNHSIEAIDFMWLDMQGHELTALKHATTILPTLRVVYLETIFVRGYEGQPLYDEVKKWMTDHGFRLLALDFNEEEALLGETLPKGRQWFGNALFIREDLIRMHTN